jgi:hypothetical protein
VASGASVRPAASTTLQCVVANHWGADGSEACVSVCGIHQRLAETTNIANAVNATPAKVAKNDVPWP